MLTRSVRLDLLQAVQPLPDKPIKLCAALPRGHPVRHRDLTDAIEHPQRAADKQQKGQSRPQVDRKHHRHHPDEQQHVAGHMQHKPREKVGQRRHITIDALHHLA